MDIEDWYHLDYFDITQCNKQYSMLDGISKYCELLGEHNVSSSFFVLGEIAESIKSTLLDISNEKHDIGSHGLNHTRPMKLSISQFHNDLLKSKHILEGIINKPILGYRAPCFSLDRERLEVVKKAGYMYDSSKIDFGIHPLYENINMTNFNQIQNNIYESDSFIEFEVSTKKFLGKNIPLSGGGYLRLLPWYISKKLIEAYLNSGDLYVLYIHPFELSSALNPLFPTESKWHTKFRFGMGRNTVAAKLSKLIMILKENGYRFTTFSSLRKELLNQEAGFHSNVR